MHLWISCVSAPPPFFYFLSLQGGDGYFGGAGGGQDHRPGGGGSGFMGPGCIAGCELLSGTGAQAPATTDAYYPGGLFTSVSVSVSVLGSDSN